MPLPTPRHVPSQGSAPHPASPPQDSAAPEELPAQSGEWQDDSPWQDGPNCQGPGCGEGCCDGCDNCCHGSGRGFGLCGGACGSRCGHLGHVGYILPQSWQLFAGVQGFKGPPDQGNNGNFGINEGFNLGGTLLPRCGIGYQFGGRWVQSNLSGSNAGVQRTDERDQTFSTVGLFRRVPCGCGLQGGVVWDVLRDEYYVDMTLQQIRGELSFVGPCMREFGFMFAAATEDDTEIFFNTVEIWEATDQYAFFYRSPLCNGGQFRVWAGWTGNSDALLGGDLSLPITDCLALATNVNYLIPDENGVASISQESWNVGINLVWYPRGGARCPSACRPLFNVADNGSLMIDRRNIPLLLE
jgi:hypothetical protein